MCEDISLYGTQIDTAVFHAHLRRLEGIVSVVIQPSFFLGNYSFNLKLSFFASPFF